MISLVNMTLGEAVDDELMCKSNNRNDDLSRQQGVATSLRASAVNKESPIGCVATSMYT